MLAMAFFSSILFISAATFVQILGIYNKGIAVKQMNQAGRTLTDSVIRAGNSAGSSSPLQATLDRHNRPQCIRLGSVTYLLSYTSDEDGGADAAEFPYRLDNGQLANFVRMNDPNAACPAIGPTAPQIPVTSVSPVLNNTLRAYDSSVQVSPATRSVHFVVRLGTYAGVGAASNAALDATTKQLSCPIDSIGNFCAHSTYDTVLYLPNLRS
jgi:hypothetical protein